MSNTDTPTRSCVSCSAPCRYVLCDACYAAAPIAEETESSSRPEPARSESYGLPVSVGGVYRF